MTTVLDELEFTVEAVEPPPPSAMDQVVSLVAAVAVMGLMFGMMKSMRRKT